MDDRHDRGGVPLIRAHTAASTDLAASLAAEITGRVAAAGAPAPRVALVLGSGLGAFADTLEDPLVIPFGELEAMPKSTVPGHAGRFVIGHIGGVPTICQQGRVHLYEGWSAEVVTRAARAFGAMGVRSLILTNAAGGLTPGWPIPCLMRIADHVNMQGVTPLGPGQAESSVSPYDTAVAGALSAAATETGVALREGVYVGLSGPSYESAAEIRMLQGLGAQAVGMSTVLEATAGWAAGLRVGAVSCITNPGAGIAAAPLDHGEVVEAGRAIASDFARLLGAAVPRLDRS